MGWQQVAAQQGGVVSRAQLAASGVGSSAADRMVRSGRLDPDPRWRGVFRAAGAAIGDDGLAWAAVLASGGVVSFHTAAVRWAVPVPVDRRLHITVPDRRRVNPRWGVRVHRVRLPAGATTVLDGLPVTTRSETVFDCLGALPRGVAMTLADRAVQQRWIDERSLLRRLIEQPGRWGNTRLREILDRLDPGVEAESERRFQALLRAAGITGWVAQHEVRGTTGRRMRIDVAFPARRLAVEIDGRAAHQAAERFGPDRARGNDLVRLGWDVVHYTWDDLRDRPHEIVAELRELLAA